MREERNSSRERSKTLVWCTSTPHQETHFRRRDRPTGQGISHGQEESNEDETELFGGKQLAFALYMAYEEDSANSNVQRVLQQGYQVNMRPRSVPLDVKIEIVKHSNKDHDGINISVPEMIAGVDDVQRAFANSLSAKHMN